MPTLPSLVALLRQGDTIPPGAGADAPPIVGFGAQLTLAAFLVVMLVVPWLMARGAAGEETDHGAEGAGRDPVGRIPGRGDDDAPPRSFFTSDRERRLWIWAGVALAAIYSTLGPAAEVAAALRARGILGLTSGAVLLGVAAAVAVPWARRRPGRREVGAAIGITAVYLTTLIRLPVPEARSHLFEYGFVAVLIYHALTERRLNGRGVPIPALTAWVATALVGWIDEGIQAWLPTRVYDLVDVGFNAFAALIAIVATLLMSWSRKGDLLKRLRHPLG